ncbi:hypothetical protein AXF42_Ash011067 [Apostasia shenzhenica]|uniref:Uncharacterized protein n=1 Tax=Apostasia shenzhenica TaxID=1088818 RepID=A0A2H9ZR12_9ASPA|nr:hypothetical protein AXF42_Ash011067 [Apostasia shenzhenica]
MASLCRLLLLLLLLLLLFNVVTMTTIVPQPTPEIKPIGPWNRLPHSDGIHREVSERHACNVMVECYNHENENPFEYAEISFPTSLNLLSQGMEAYTRKIWIHGRWVRQYRAIFYATMRQGGILTAVVYVRMLLAVHIDSRLSYNLNNVIDGTVFYKVTIVRPLQPGEHLY